MERNVESREDRRAAKVPEPKAGEQLTLEQINLLRQRKKAGGKPKPNFAEDDGKPSDGMTVEQLREALTAKGIDIPADAKKADLQKLLDEAA